MFHELLRVWFSWVENWGYLGIFALMAMESSIIPVPSEIVMPPAAFWAAQGRFSMTGVILAGTAGSYFGSVLNYFFFQSLGRPLLRKHGKLLLLPPEKLALAEAWVNEYGTFGIFTARLLPVVRHLISIPAGLLKMGFAGFSIATILGAGLWVAVLSWFGQSVLGSHPELLQSPEAMMATIKSQLHWFVLAVVLLGGLYGLVLRFRRKAGAPGLAV